MTRPDHSDERQPGSESPDTSDAAQLVEVRRMLAATGVARPPDSDTAEWLWAVLAEHAQERTPAACPRCGTVCD